jgi:coenzyme F420-reducing hydrogenase gamma subunit
MTQKKKATVASFDFTSCEGCQIELTNYGDKTFLGLLDHVEFVEFREAMSERTTETIDISLVEGSFSREADRKRLEDIRARSRIVIAMGACAVNGGINALKNHTTDYSKEVYGDKCTMKHLDSHKALPVSAAIKVDYELPGCPMSKDEFVHVVSSLLHGKEPLIPNHPVCVECKSRETVCRYQQNDHCLGLVAKAGCGAPCPADGIPCEACRGFVHQANLGALETVLVEKAGFSAERAKSKARMFANNELEKARS